MGATSACASKLRSGQHNLTVPAHREVAKGTLNDILTRVSLWNSIPKEELLLRRLTE